MAIVTATTKDGKLILDDEPDKLRRDYLALLGSVGKWTGVAYYEKAENSSRDCPCCRVSDGCGDCPIDGATDDGCNGTPYEDWLGHQEETHDETFSPYMVRCDTCRDLAIAELDFLADLAHEHLVKLWEREKMFRRDTKPEPKKAGKVGQPIFYCLSTDANAWCSALMFKHLCCSSTDCKHKVPAVILTRDEFLRAGRYGMDRQRLALLIYDDEVNWPDAK